MGISNSRAKICKVTPKEEPAFDQAASAKITTAVQRLTQHQQGILGHGHHQLPPIKQHLPQIVPSPPDSQNFYAKPSSNHSIIKSHPPQRAKIWQPIVCSMEPPGASKAYNEQASMDWSNEVVKQYSIPNHRGHCVAGSSLQRNKGGFLQAQTFLIGEATKKRQSHQRCLRDQRKMYTSTVGGVGNVQIKGIRLVSRPTQRDIFWDETEGQNLDFRELLQPSPPRTGPDAGIQETSSRLKSETGLKDTSDESVTKSSEGITQQNLLWLEDFRKNELKHLQTRNVLDDQWEPKHSLDTPWKHGGKEDIEIEWSISGNANTVDQKWNSWDKHT